MKKKIIVIGIGDKGKKTFDYIQKEYENASNIFYKNNLNLCFIDIDKNTINESKIDDNIFLESEKNKDLETILNKEEILSVANNNKEKISSKIRNFDIVFVVSGIGGITGGIITNLICDICREENKILILNVLKPFNFESNIRKNNFISYLEEIKNKTNGMLIISSNQDHNNFSLEKVLDDNYNKIFNNIKAISDLFLKDGPIMMNFLDVKNFFSSSNFISIGNAFEYDQNKIAEAIKEAIFDCFSEIDISEAKKIICIINCFNNDILFNNVNNCLELISNIIGNVETKVVLLNDKSVKLGKININIIGNNFENNLTDNFFVLENESSKIKNIIDGINNVFENNKNEIVNENDILPFFIKNPDNKYGSKK